MSDMSKYYNKPINPEYYKRFEIMGNPDERTTKLLSKQEFLSGKNGVVYMDNATGQLIFSDKRNREIHMVDVAQLAER